MRIKVAFSRLPSLKRYHRDMLHGFLVGNSHTYVGCFRAAAALLSGELCCTLNMLIANEGVAISQDVKPLL